ncbi:MAG: hypothetical protein MI922_14715 [Bacteroidales bacterium]|nr:hypothetical protein [Bacteroidales bacterium]
MRNNTTTAQTNGKLSNVDSENSNFENTSYFPIRDVEAFIYSGFMGKIEINPVAGKKNAYRADYFLVRSSKHIYSEDYHYDENGVCQWTTLEFNGKYPKLEFDPPIIFYPISDKVGDKKSLLVNEIRHFEDGSKEIEKLQIDYHVDAICDQRSRFGHFKNCIKMSMRMSYPNNPKQKHMHGKTTWWFAPEFGVIKYKMKSIITGKLKRVIKSN